jgi:hypothetical protein
MALFVAMPQAGKGNYKAVKTGLIFAIQNRKYVECEIWPLQRVLVVILFQ